MPSDATSNPRSNVIVRAFRLQFAIAVLGCTAMALAGCGSAQTPKPLAASSGNGPDQVAMSYARSLFSGDFDAASQRVDSAGRGSFLALTAGLGPSSVRGHDLAVGSSSVTGTSAVVVLTGTLCSTHSLATLSAAAQSPGAGCISNADPHSLNPIFRIDLSYEAGRWLVTFRTPQTSPVAPSTSATSTQAAVPSPP